MKSIANLKDPTAYGYACVTALTTVAALVFSLIAVFLTPIHLFAAVGLWSLSIVMLPPALSPRYDLFSPWSFIILSVLVGLTLRGFYISFAYPNPAIIERLFLRGEKPGFFLKPALILLTGLIALTTAYLWNPFKKLRTALPNNPIQKQRLYTLIFAILAISLVSTTLYIILTGGLESRFISAKRTPIPGLELSGKNYQSYGSLRFFSSLAIFAHLLVLGDLLKSKSLGRFWKIPLALILFLLACSLPFYASVRSTIATYVFLSAAVFYYSSKKLPIFKFALAGIILIIAVYVMTLLRAERDDSSALSKFSPGSQAFNSLILNRNQIELAKTAHIINAIPDQLPYQYGKTIAIWALAPIPRSLWRDKPLIQPGPIIGNQIYQQKRAGVPPSLIAELCWNFALPGVLIGSLLLGAMLRFLHQSFAPQRTNGDPNPAQIFFYVVAPMLFGFQAIGSNLGYALFWLVMNTIIALVILKLITPRTTTTT
ncbi:MAG: oligosaccharide repeat unit polymerase [Verrucomicrobiales bacterium]|nr:oligosaccharide repeat unit polymerase [Verrucomicrobiales bacterium]